MLPAETTMPTLVSRRSLAGLKIPDGGMRLDVQLLGSCDLHLYLHIIAHPPCLFNNYIPTQHTICVLLISCKEIYPSN
jgi:hypothetical protein